VRNPNDQIIQIPNKERAGMKSPQRKSASRFRKKHLISYEVEFQGVNPLPSKSQEPKKTGGNQKTAMESISCCRFVLKLDTGSGLG